MIGLKATAALYYDKRRTKKGGKFPVKIRVYFDDEKRTYKTGVELTKEDWNKMNSMETIRSPQLKKIQKRLKNLLDKAESIISELSPFSFSDFKSAYLKPEHTQTSASLKTLFGNYISVLEKNDQIGTAISYKTTINSLEKFRFNLKVTDVTTDTLRAYENWILNQNLSSSTAGIYLRQLRAIINIAISQELLPRNKYPFYNYTIPTARNVKKALKEDQLSKLFKYETSDLRKRKALDFWIFSYLSNGMNMADICLLKTKDVGSKFFSFLRMKTIRTKKKDLRPIAVPLTDRTKVIITKWKNQESTNPYLFPILESGLTARQVKYRIQDHIAFVNKHMKLIAADLGISSALGTYVARHSHATILKRKGAPTQLIKENLGHSSILTTESYLDDFEDEMKLNYAKLLTQF